jgi:tetratricopeptide (TPR) repeat protein
MKHMTPQVEDLLVRWEETRQAQCPETVESLCREHTELRSEVRQRIEALQRMYRVLSMATSDDDPFDSSQSEALPEIKGYQCLAQIGCGGMGVVYRARQIGLGRSVAIKMLRGGFSDRRSLARFRTEAESVARLKHPNIVQIHDVGEYQQRPFLVFEYVDGGNLSEWIDGQPQSEVAAAALVRNVAEGLAVAHGQGIVHRDVKPANVLLMRRTERSTDKSPTESRANLSDFVPKITDFGIAKQLGMDAPMTESGELMGTPAYMAPEQTGVRGFAVSPATDVFALGVTLYELLVGRSPFVTPSRMETVQRVQTQDPVAPSQLQPTIARDLENVCLKCLEKDPSRRYPDATALADDLDRFLRGEPVRARPIGRVQRVGRWCHRNPTTALLVGLLVLACGAGLAGVSWKWREAEVARSRAQANYLRALRAVDESFDVLGRETSEDSPPVREIRQKLLTRAAKFYAELSRDLKQARSNEPENQHLLASTLMNLATLHYELKQPQTAEEYHRQALKIWSALMSQPGDQTRSLRESSLAHYNLGNVQRTLEQFDDAAQSYKTAILQTSDLLKAGKRSDMTKRCLRNSRWGLARALDQLGRHAEATEQWKIVVQGSSGRQRDHMQIELACSQARAGQHAVAQRTARKVASAPNVDASLLGACGRLLSICAEAASQEAHVAPATVEVTVDAYQSQAIACLERAVASSEFPGQEILIDLSQHRDFQFLRERGAFEHLLAGTDLIKAADDARSAHREVPESPDDRKRTGVN